jgi:hypothetical protein
MHCLHRQTGWLSLAIALSVIALPATASADSLLSEILANDRSEAWLPAPVDIVEEAGQARDDEAGDYFQWAADEELGFLMSFDPEEEEVFLGWQIEF